MKDIFNAMQMYGDSESNEEVDVEKLFNLSKKDNKEINPFSQEQLEATTKKMDKLKEDENSAQGISGLALGNFEDEKLEERVVESTNRFNSFEEESHSAETNIKVTINETTDEQKDDVDIVIDTDDDIVLDLGTDTQDGNNVTLDLDEFNDLTVNQANINDLGFVNEEKQIQDKLESISEKVSGQAILDEYSGNKVTVTEVEDSEDEEDDIKIIVEDEDADEVEMKEHMDKVEDSLEVSKAQSTNESYVQQPVNQPTVEVNKNNDEANKKATVVLGEDMGFGFAEVVISHPEMGEIEARYPYNGMYCSECNKPQFVTPKWVTCKSNHNGAIPLTANQLNEKNNNPVESTKSIGILNLFDTPNGSKLRKPAVSPTPHGTELNLDAFEDGKQVSADVYIESAKLGTFKQGGNTKYKVDYQFICREGRRLKGVQFNVPDGITSEIVSTVVGKVVRVVGKFSTFRNIMQITVENIDSNLANAKKTNFIEAEDDSVYDVWYNTLYNAIKRDWLKVALDRIFIDNNLMELMKQGVAAVSVHDAKEKGLFYHTMKVTMNSYLTSQVYPSVDSDVIIFSGFTHDVGKIYEIQNGDYTDLGNLVGHIIIGYSLVRDTFNLLKTEGYPVEDKVVQNILHCILAHHGQLEWGSPVIPKTREARILHQCDSLDASVTHMDEQLKGEKSAYSSILRAKVFDLNN